MMHGVYNRTPVIGERVVTRERDWGIEIRKMTRILIFLFDSSCSCLILDNTLKQEENKKHMHFNRWKNYNCNKKKLYSDTIKSIDS